MIRDAEEWRKPHLEEGQRIISYRENRLFAPGVSVDEGRMGLLDIVPDNILHGYHRTLSANLSVGAPRLLVQPLASQHEGVARDREARANYNLRANHWNEQLRYWKGNTLDYGWGVLQIGFDIPHGGYPGRADKRGVSRAIDVVTGANGNGDGTGQEVALPFQRDAVDVDPKNPLLWTDQSVVQGTVWLKSLMNEDFV